MANFYCFPSLLVGKKKKNKGSHKSVGDGQGIGKGTFKMKLKNMSPSYKKCLEETSFDFFVPLATQKSEVPCKVEVVKDNNLFVAESAYEGGDEHDDNLSMRREYSDFDLQEKASKEDLDTIEPNMNDCSLETKADRCETDLMIKSGHVSDPGMGQATAFWGSPRLKRSCSNIETRVSGWLPSSPMKSRSYTDLRYLSGITRGKVSHAIKGSPFSVATPRSADGVMLKKHSSSHVLPSRSRKLWWKLFLWSHRNLHNPWTPGPVTSNCIIDSSNKKGGYTSDTLEPSHVSQKNCNEAKGKSKISDQTEWLHNQWVAFSAESSSLGRVDAWVNTLDDNLINPAEDEDGDGTTELPIIFPASPEAGKSSAKIHPQTSRHAAEEVLQANIVVQSLNSLSAVAHISGMGLKVVPVISAFTSLRSVNLSGNFIVHINPGSLPKGLHVLDLSRNKIVTIEGLRELTRLRVLNLSYNRISRIGHGLSNCTLIKELYLAGNKISNVEGLHRLLKLSVLDLSFNKITTAKALGQLVANYHSLQALNLLGNPIQSNIGDDHLRKAVSGLLPHLTYLNKQPIKPQRAREAATDSIARAALGDSGWNFRRKAVKRVSQGSGSSVMSRVGDRGLGGGGGGHRSSKQRSKSRHLPSGKK